MATKITIAIPNIDAMVRHIDVEIIHKNTEIIIGDKTTIFRVIVTSVGVMKLEPMQSVYAFCTDNYKRLESSIKYAFAIDAAMRFSSIPLCINFDGEPGTGKTTFASYIAASGIFNRIIVYNLVQAVKDDFMQTITMLERHISSSVPKDLPKDPETILLIIDEIDKWLESYINCKIHICREEARVKKNTQTNDNQKSITSETYVPLTEMQEKEKKIQLKYDFLDQLYKLVDGLVLSDIRRYVVIFNTNNFDNLFNGIDERYKSLYDRFQIYKFRKNNKNEVISYLQGIYNKLKCYISEQSDSSRTHNILKLVQYDPAIFSLIPDDICISYRSLLKILRTNCFELEKTIKALSDASNGDTHAPIQDRIKN